MAHRLCRSNLPERIEMERMLTCISAPSLSLNLRLKQVVSMRKHDITGEFCLELHFGFFFYHIDCNKAVLKGSSISFSSIC